MEGLVPANEGPYPIANQNPPDQQPVDLQGALAVLDSLLWRDGGIDQNEQKVLFTWVSTTGQKIKAQQQQMAAGQGMSQGDAAGLGASSAGESDYNPYGGGEGATQDAAPAYDPFNQ